MLEFVLKLDCRLYKHTAAQRTLRCDLCKIRLASNFLERNYCESRGVSPPTWVKTIVFWDVTVEPCYNFTGKEIYGVAAARISATSVNLNHPRRRHIRSTVYSVRTVKYLQSFLLCRRLTLLHRSKGVKHDSKLDVCLSLHLCICVEKKNQLDATECFIALIICSTCFGHFYAHYQELETICVLLSHMVCSAWLLVVGGQVQGSRLCVQEEGCCTTFSRDGHISARNMLSIP